MFYNSSIRQFLSFFLVASLTVFFTHNSFPQSGPGGVGNSDGSTDQPENIIWFAADSLSLSNNEPVSLWNDISGNGNNGTQSTSSSQPEYLTGQINGLPAVSFDGTDDHILYDGSLIANDDYTFIAVAQRRSNSGRQIITGGSTGSANQNLHFFWYNSGTTLNSHHYGNDFESPLISNTEPSSGGTDQNEYGIFSTLLNSGAGYREHLQNDSVLDTHTNGTQLSSYDGAAIGRYVPTSEYGNIDVAEIIVYSSPLNHAQLTIVHNYLSEKYDINIINDFFADTADYNHFIAGIGKESNGSHERAASGGVYFSQNGDLDDGEYLFVSNDSAVNNVSTLKKGSQVTSTGAEAAWNREWFMEQTGTFNATIAFDFSEGIENGKYPQELSNYILLYRADTTSDYSVVSFSERGIQNSDQVYFDVSAADVNNGYYTLASTDTTESPLQGDEVQTWYSLKSGDWSNPATWTLDPSGALPDNPDNEIPGETDKVEILSGNQVTVQSATDSIQILDASVKGRLDLTTAKGHDFGSIEGDGKVLMAADNFPDGNASGFVSDEGTVEFYGNSYVLDSTRTFYDVIVNMNSVSDTLTLLNDYTIKGDFSVEQGTFRINDNSSTTILNLEVIEDVVVNSQARIITGEGNTVNGNYSIGGTMPDDDGKEFHDIFHQFIIKGDFTNNGTVRFTNLNAPDYDDFASNGAVTVRLKGAGDANITLNDTTDFYFLIIDKGTDKTYTAEIYSDHTRYFQLFGPNNCGRITPGSYTASHPLVRKALWVKYGTLKLTGNIHIPTLSEGDEEGGNGDYAVGENARFLMAGPSVTVYSTASDLSQILHFTSTDTYQANGITGGSSNQAMTLYGEFKITDGFFGTRNSAGFIFWPSSNAQVKIEGGECHVAQMRSAGGASGVASYTQSGGTVYAFGNEGPNGGEYNGDYPLFGLEEPSGVFQMSGGEIILQDHDGDADPEFFLPSLETNYNVTGGKVTFDLPDGTTAQISTTVPLYNMTLANSTLEVIDTNLHVLNDLTLETGNTRTVTAGSGGESNTYGSYLDLVPGNANPRDLYVGGDLTVGDSTVLDVWGWTGSDNSISATLYFNGSNDAVFQIGDITSYTNALLEYESPDISDGGPDGNFPSSDPTGEMHPWKYNLPLYNLIVDKPNGKLSLAANSPGKGGSWGSDPGQAGNWVCSNGGKNTRRWLSQLLSIKNQFKLLNGTFSQMDPYNNVTITENGGGTYGSVGDPVGYSVNFYTTDVEIRDTMFVYESGSTPKEGIIEVRSPNPLTLTTTDDAFIGNMRFIDDHNNPVTLTSDVHFGRIEYMNGTIDIGKYNLKVDLFETYAVDHSLRMDAVSSGQPVFEVPNFIRMAGNASDGGLSLKVPKNPTWPLPDKEEYEYPLDSYSDKQGPYAFPDRLWFPIGTDASGSDKYTPAVCRLQDYGTTDGDEYITVRVVDQELQTTDLSGDDILSYYWNVDFEGYADGEEPTVSWMFQYDDSDLDIGAGEEVSFVPGKVLDGGDYTRSDEGDSLAVKDGGAGTIEGNILGGDPRNIIIFNGTGTSNSPVTEDSIDNIASRIFNTDATGPNINSNWEDAWPNTGFTLENANYTAGEANRFVGEPDIYYTKYLGDAAQTDWEDGTIWTLAPDDIDGNGQVDSYELHDSRQPDAGDYPQEGDIAVIGWVPYGDPNYPDGEPHGVEVDNSVNFAELRFNQMLDANNGDPTSRVYAYNFQFRPTVCINPGGSLDGNIITGEGLFWCRSVGGDQVDPDYSNNDIGDFVEQDSSYFVYESTDDAFVYNNIPSEVPNLLISGDLWGDANRDFEISNDINIKANFDLLGDINLILSSGANGDITVENNLKIYQNDANGNNSGGYGEIAFPNDASRQLEIGGDLKLVNEQALIHIRNPNTTVNTSYLTVHGNIFQDNNNGGGLQLFSAANEDYVELALKGDGDHAYSVNSGAMANLYNLVMNKGIDRSSTFTFHDDFTLNGPTSGVNVEKALIMENGTLLLDDPDINIDLTTGDDDFYIPGTAGLEVRQGQVNASGNSGILLDGKLHINGGTVDMSGGDNYIEYSSSGESTIEVSSGMLTVGSQIRRKTTTEEGILNYRQTGGTVVAGENSAPEDDRGVFEILNSGSNLELTGGELYVANAQNNPSIASLYLDPASSDLTSGGKIILGHSSTGNNQTIGINSNISIPKLFADDASGNSPEVKMRVRDLTVTDSLNIGSGINFDTDGLSLYMQGDFIAGGTYSANGNTTYFEGNNDQEITGKTQFYDLYKTTSDSLFLNDTITVNNEFRLEDGVLHDQGNNLAVKGNMHNDGEHVWGGSGDGILVNGSENQEVTGNGIYGKLSVNNVEGLTIPVVGNNIYINDALQMENGVLDIGKNLLELDSNAVIIEKSAFSENNMVQTNISFTDAGVRKYFPKIEKDTTFTYPLGSGGKYTPVVFDIDSSLQHGYIRVKAANERHPSIQEDSESPCELKDSLNVLQYHWLIETQNISGFDANVSMYAEKEDVWVDNSCGYTEADYITARLLENSVLWNKFDPFSFDESVSRLDFVFSNADDAGLTGDYTAGIDSTGFDGAIPDSVPVYHSAQNGNWKENSTWEEDIVGGPRGAIVIIDDSVTVTENYLVSYKTILEPSGILLVNSTFGHRLGLAEGQGTLSTWRGDLPAADYEEFFSDTGGTLEYAGTNNLDILSGIPALNNLRFVNTGSRRFPNQDITLYGNLEILGVDNSLNVINEYDKTFNIQENITFSRGSFDAGTGTNAEVILNGNSLQTISGSFKNTATFNNAFNYLELNNSSGVEILDSVEVDETFTLTDGMVYLPDSGLVTLNSTANGALSGANSSRYIQGPLRKRINNGDTYTFEVGDTSRYGKLELSNTDPTTSEYWEVQYYDNNPDNYGYDTSLVIDPLIEVSGNEFWRVGGPSGATADVEIRWDDESVLPAKVEQDSLHIAKWRSDRWEDVGNDVTDHGLDSGYVKTGSPEEVDGDSIFTLASAQTLPKATAAFTTGDTTVCEEGVIALTVKVTGEPDITFTVNKGPSLFDTYTVTGEKDTTIIISNDASASDEATYAIDSVGDFNGEGVVYGDSVTVTVQAPPSPVIDLGGDTAVCQNSTHIYSVTDNSDHDYSWNIPDGDIVSGSGSHEVQVEWLNDGMQRLVEVTEGVSSLPGCETTVDTAVNVYETPEPNVTAVPLEICYPDTVDLNAGDEPTTGIYDFNYTWTPDSVNNQTVKETYFAPTGNLDVASETINFKVVIENAGNTSCSASDSVDVTIFRQPETGDLYYIPNDFDL